MEESEKSLKKAGQIAQEAVSYARSLIKPKMPLLEIAEKIESKIEELGGKPAFPVNLSINEIAAHATPSFQDTAAAFGLLKVDIGVHVDGWIADTALSLDLEDSQENKALIKSSQDALDSALSLVKSQDKIKIREIGRIIEKTIKSSGFQPIQNLSGHSIEKFEVHAGITIPNYDNSQEKILGPGVYAIEPFATSGLGSVKDGKPSGIYSLKKPGNVRDSFAREVLRHIEDTYQTLPFCSRWLYKKFGSKSILALKRIQDAGLIHQYPQLIESSSKKVSQAEHTILLSDKEKIITTLAI